MEQNTIERGARLIINFMGVKPIKHPTAEIYSWKDGVFFYVSETTEEKVMDAIVKYSKYHTSWNWLKPVIDKIIESIGFKTVDECSDEEWFQSTRITQMYIGVSIETAFFYVTEYLEWFNKSK